MNQGNNKPDAASARGWTLARRDVLARSGLAIAGLASGAYAIREPDTTNKTILSFGMVTDLHYADTDARRDRFYRESTAKLGEAVRLMNYRQVDFMIELGDFKDQREPASEESALQDLSTIEAVFAGFNGPRYHALGNHDMDFISKKQFLAQTENSGIKTGKAHYSFDCKGVHFVVLDANYASDGSDYDHGKFQWADSNIPQHQLEWLEHDLKSTGNPAIVFIHQQLDPNGGFSIRNAVYVRRVLENSRKVLAVFQGHHHEGFYSRIAGIHYYTQKAMVDGSGAMNSSYSIVEVKADNRIVVSGYCKAVSTTLATG